MEKVKKVENFWTFIATSTTSIMKKKIQYRNDCIERLMFTR